MTASAVASMEARASLAAPPLDHGVIGNCRVLALISPTSAVEWLCLPRFDSPSVFARLLDHDHGGTFRVLTGQGEELRGALDYLPNTNVLRTTFRRDDQEWEVIDFAPRIVEGLGVRAPLEITRLIRPVRGHAVLRVDFDPRPDYARAAVETVDTGNGIVVHGAGTALHLASNLPASYILARREFALDRPIFFVFSYGPRAEPATLEGVQVELQRTVAGWRAWAKSCSLPSFAPERVLRSALCLKMHASSDTGAVIAAATTSIPEAMGTPRTWDYRYCWLRDAAFVVEALRRIGQLDEGERFIHFLRDVAEGGPLQPVYGIAGERDLEEVFLPHLVGFGNNGFVRIGNAAALQRQHDLMGEMVLCLGTLLSDPRLVHEDPHGFWPLVERFVEDSIKLAPEKDMGIWEFRTHLGHYTFSRAMCWVAMKRGAELARRFGRLEQVARWEQEAAREREIILARGYNPRLGFFTQALDGEQADAANLLLPTIGIIDAHDPRFASTVNAYGNLLMNRGLLQRYVNPDDFGETTSAFTICSFWYVEALALMGRVDDAIALFEHLCRFANPAGLFSEDVEPSTGTLLGNFPQAYTHVGLINAAMTIGERLDARAGRAWAWR
jgi:alpha,alpha-trehalase